MHHGDTRTLHLSDGIADIIGPKIHTAAGVLNQTRLEAELNRVQRSELHAIIRREAADENIGDALRFEPFAEACGFAMPIIEQAAVTIDAGVRALRKNLHNPIAAQSSSQFRTFGILHAMHRPERLREESWRTT